MSRNLLQKHCSHFCGTSASVICALHQIKAPDLQFYVSDR